MANTSTTNFHLVKADDGTTSHSQFLTDYGNNLDIIDSNIFSGSYDDLTDKPSTIANVSEDTTPELGGEMDCGEHSIGFTEKSNTSSSGAVTINWTQSNKQKITLTENTSATFTDPGNPSNLLLRLIQNASGTNAITFSPTIKWPGGEAPTFSTDANAIDILTLYYDGSTYYGQAGIAFATSS